MLDKENFEFIKNIDDPLKKATMLANLCFEGKKDKGGHPYLNHLQFVSNSFDELNREVVGMLHDIIEDTVVSRNILIELGFSEEIVNAIVILTKDTDNYEEYIDSIINSENLIAIDVKLKDLEHNMDISRIDNPKEEDYERLKKYNKMYKKIEGMRKTLC